MSLGNLIKKICRRIRGVFVKPIRVFCFHQVSDVFEPEKCFECDWTNIDQFKKVVLSLQEKYTFISLEEAYKHIHKDKIRMKNYAALTSDDGYHSLLNILPWLEYRHIPITLFINSQYLDNKHYIKELYRQAKSVKPNIDEESFVKNLYLTKDDLLSLNSEWVSIGLHGYEHVSVVGMNEDEFESQFGKNKACLKELKGFVPFYAYTFGKHTQNADKVLKKHGIIPVLLDGCQNVNDSSVIHRECIDKW